MLDECYLENDSSACSNWQTAGYTTEAVMVGMCVPGLQMEPAQQNEFRRCSGNSSEVEYVRFNDAECCELSFVFRDNDGPSFQAYDVEGCNDGVYVEAQDVMCLMPEGAQDEDVATDNTSDECNGVARVLTSVAFAMVAGGVVRLY